MTDTDWFDVASLCEAFQNTVARCGEMLALRTPGGAQEISWREYGDRYAGSRPDSQHSASGRATPWGSCC